MGRVAHLWRDGGRSLSEGEPDLAPRKQGRRDSNPRPTVLETAALPTELRPWARRIVARLICEACSREAAAGHGCALFPARARLRGPGACGRPRGRRRGGTLDRRARRCRACDLA